MSAPPELLDAVRANARVGRAISTREATHWLPEHRRDFRVAASGLAEHRRQGLVVSAESVSRPVDVYWTTPEMQPFDREPLDPGP